MNKNFKVIEISGLSGLLILGLVFTGLICGIAIFPIWVIMNSWNSIVADIFRGPEINYLQALVLWVIFALSTFLILKNAISVKIAKAKKLTGMDIKNVKSDEDLKELQKKLQESIEESKEDAAK